jgi:hypothetical protein
MPDEHDPAPASSAPLSAIPWRLAAGVGLLEGTLAGGEPVSTHVYALVLPSGRRFQVSEPLFRLAELLQSRLPAEQIAARLGARLGRSITVADIATLVATRLEPQGVVAASARVLEL